MRRQHTAMTTNVSEKIGHVNNFKGKRSL